MERREEWERKTTEELLELYKETKDLAVKQKMMLRYIGLIKSIALQMRNVYIGFSQVEDMINEGVIVMMKAVEKYDSSKNAKFETYISKQIKRDNNNGKKAGLGSTKYTKECERCRGSGE